MKSFKIFILIFSAIFITSCLQDEVQSTSKSKVFDMTLINGNSDAKTASTESNVKVRLTSEQYAYLISGEPLEVVPSEEDENLYMSIIDTPPVNPGEFPCRSAMTDDLKRYFQSQANEHCVEILQCYPCFDERGNIAMWILYVFSPQFCDFWPSF